jgi:cytochrome c5
MKYSSCGRENPESAVRCSQSRAALHDSIEKGKNKMPAYGKSLKPDAIQALVPYIRSRK